MYIVMVLITRKVIEMENVNKQLLDAANNALDLLDQVTSWRGLSIDGKSALDVVTHARQAIAAAEQAQQAEPVSQQALEALKAHHAAAMGAGLDMSHALSQLRVQAYKESQLYRDTVAAIAATAQKGGA